MANLHLLLLIGGTGLLGGFLSGLLGIGGGIVLTPLLLYLPPLFDLSVLSIRTVAGLTTVQGVLGSFVGAVTHRKFRFLSVKLATYMGSTIFLAAFLGGASSRYVPARLLLGVFAFLALAAGVLIFLPKKEDPETPNVEGLTFSRP